MSAGSEPVPVDARAGDAPDATLIARVAGGDPAALSELYERHRTVTYSLALRITADHGAAEDVVQDAFLGVWRNASRYAEARGSVRTWILAIVHHRAIDSVRRRRPAGELPDADAPPPPSLVLPDIWPEVAGRLDRDTVTAALAALPRSQREAIELAYFGGLTQEEIARHTGAPLGTVKSRVRLGLLSLRKGLARDSTEASGAGADR